MVKCAEEIRLVTYLLWLVQALLALVFLFAGGFKLVMPIETFTPFLPLPGLFIRFIGACEVLGALGLVLPGLLKIWMDLTPLAARGLVVIMLGATMFTPPDQLPTALLPITLGLLAGFVAYGRGVPQHRPGLHPARS
jgi:DoxX-like family